MHYDPFCPYNQSFLSFRLIIVYHTLHHRTSVLFFFFCNSSPTCRGRRILAIYYVKLLATDSILKNDTDIAFDELRFAVDDDGTNILVIINKGEITGAVDIDNMYEFASFHCTDFKDLRDDEDIVINREWILNKLAEVENE